MLKTLFPMRSLLITLALLCSTGLAFSQGQKLAFRTLALAQAKFPELWVLEAGKPIPITFGSAQPSTPYSADKTSPLKIFKGPLNEKGLPSDATPSLVPMPASSSILLIAWMDDTKPGFLAIEDPFATMKREDWLIINPSKSDLAVQIGANTKTHAIKANSNQTIKITAPADTGAATTIAAQQPDKSWKRIYSGYWPVREDMRGLVIVGQDGTKYRVNFISDKILPPAPANKP
jgi:hypothetical protein